MKPGFEKSCEFHNHMTVATEKQFSCKAVKTKKFSPIYDIKFLLFSEFSLNSTSHSGADKEAKA